MSEPDALRTADAGKTIEAIVENLARRCRESLGVTVKLGTRVTALRAEGDGWF